MISRLASLHRSVIRALHVVVRSISDADVCRGVLVGCRDLVAVIRRLMLCSSQLTTVTASSQSDDILSLLDDIMVQYKHCCRIIFIKRSLAASLTDTFLSLPLPLKELFDTIESRDICILYQSYSSVLLYIPFPLNCSSFVLLYTSAMNFILPFRL